MRCLATYKIVYSCSFLPLLFSGLIAVFASTVSAEPGLANSGLANTGFYQSSRSTTSSHVNPWSLPQQPVTLPTMPPDMRPGMQPSSQQKTHSFEKYYVQPGAAVSSTGRNSNENDRSHRGRFVTPDILKSLQQQQKQYQVMPRKTMPDKTIPNKSLNSPYGSQQYGSPQSNPAWTGQNNASSPIHNSPIYDSATYGSPVYGAGSVNPLYSPPAVSPWGSGMDVLNHGESFPMIPSEAIGGFSPMHVPSYGMNNFKNDGSDGFLKSDDMKVFNPFTFLPNSGL